MDDVNNLVGDDDLLARDYVGMCGDDTILGGFGEDLIVDGSGADSISGGLGDDAIFTVEVDDDRFDGSDIVDGGMGDDHVVFDDGDTVTGGMEAMLLCRMPTPMIPIMNPLLSRISTGSMIRLRFGFLPLIRRLVLIRLDWIRSLILMQIKP